MITDSFDPRTLANMEVALERACKILGGGSEGHQARRHIACKIVECAESGDGTLGGLTRAGRVAATELCATGGAIRGKLNQRSNLILPSRRTALAEVTLH
jgi:hypothetical protein